MIWVQSNIVSISDEVNMSDKMYFPKRIAIGSDHVGYELKNVIKAYLAEVGIECLDLGAFSGDRTDYPLYAGQVTHRLFLEKLIEAS